MKAIKETRSLFERVIAGMGKSVLLLFAIATATVGYAQQPVYKNAKLSSQTRAADLLRRMTVDEKLMQLQCMWGSKKKFMNRAGGFDAVGADTMLKNGLGQIARINEGLKGDNYGIHPGEGAKLYNEVQRYFVTKTRLGIPVMIHEESLHGQQSLDATNFPVPIALASTWDEALHDEIYSAVAEEVRARGGHQVLAPVIDVVRDPRWGRTEETMGEDPYLITRLALAQLKAYQGGGDYLARTKVAATLKHFGVHGWSEGGNNVAPSHVDERTAREVFFPPFKASIQEGKVMSVMPTYNELFGVPVHGSKYLLTDVLRKEWGFNGVIVSDYGGVNNIFNIHKTATDKKAAALAAFKAGVDIETSDPTCFPFLKELLKEGKITIAEVDEHVLRILQTKFRLGLFENPYVDETAAEAIVGNPQSRALALKAAQESMVLLKNENNFLPLERSKIKTVAFIGPNAAKCLLGGYSSKPRQCISPLQAAKEKYGSNMNVLYAEGVTITNINDWFSDSVKLADTVGFAAKIAEAVSVAQKADVVVLFLGSNESTNREAWGTSHLGDLPTLELLNGQLDLLNAISATGKPVCAVINSGPPLNLVPVAQKLPAILQAWYLGQEGGYAVVDALFGDVNPSGKLPISMHRGAGYLPSFYNHKPSSRRGYHLGYDVTPLYPFGHGLSYTTFTYSNLALSSPIIKKPGTATVTVTVENTGSREGVEVVQLYVRDDFSSVTRPVKELKGFQRISLKVGEKKQVSFTVTPEMLSFYNESMKWVVEPGDFTIMVGGSSATTNNIKLTVQ